MTTPFKWPIVAIVYFGLFIISVIIMIAASESTALAGVYSLAITIPWSFVLSEVFLRVNPDIFENSMVPGLVIVSFSAIINIVILYYIERAVRRSKRHNA